MKISITLLMLSNFYMTSFSQSLKSQLEPIRNKYGLMGLSVAVVKDGKIKYTTAVGIQDFEENRKMTTGSMFRIASISKTITATALMILYDEGKFSLDQDICTILNFKVRNPYFPDVPITPRMLISHTSSFIDGDAYNNFLTASFKTPVPPPIRTILDTAGNFYSKSNWFDKKPGTWFSYSNLNFVIIGTLVEKLSGERFDLFCKKRIFDKLGMEASNNVALIKKIKRVSPLYIKQDGKWETRVDNYKGKKQVQRDLKDYIVGDNGIIYSPHGGVRTSPGELAKFMIMHMNNGIYKRVRILSDSAARTMHSSQWINPKSNADSISELYRSWGCGIHLTSGKPEKNYDIVIPGKQLIGHRGEAYGLVSGMYYDPSERWGMIFMVNGCATDYKPGTRSAFHAVEEELYDLMYSFVKKK